MARIPTFMGYRSVALLMACALLLGGCSTLRSAGSYEPPPVAAAAQWHEERPTGVEIAAGEAWWRSFDDPVLTGLVERALRSNNNLAAAAIKVRRAQLEARLTGTNLTPSVTAGGNAALNRDLESGRVSRTSSLTGNVSYEVDLWGRLAAARDAAGWEAEATEEDRQSTALALIETTITAYWKVAWLNERIAAARQNIDLAQKSAELSETRYAAGAVSAADPLTTRQTLAARKADLTELLLQQSQARAALTIIFDQSPGTPVPERDRLPEGALPEVSAGTPADLLRKRPDLRAARDRLKKLQATVDSTRAAYYPALTLTGGIGTNGAGLLDILGNPYGTLAANLALPFLQWNTMNLNVEIATSDRSEAESSFRDLFRTAEQEVENALAARSRYDQEKAELEESLSLARRAEELAEVRYREGATDLQPLMDARATRISAETSLLQNRLNRLEARLSICRATGGGATVPLPSPPPASSLNP